MILCRDSVEHYHHLRDLFYMDPLLLPVFVRVCPKKELAGVFMYIPPSVSIAYISYLVSSEGWTKVEVKIAA